MKYVSRPVEVEAMRWTEPPRSTPGDRAECAREIVAWVNANGGEARYETRYDGIAQNWELIPESYLWVRTINGWVIAAPGHYIVMGDAEFRYTKPSPDPQKADEWVGCRDFYPCDPETFERRWEARP